MISAPTEKTLPSPSSTTAPISRASAKREKTSAHLGHIANVTAFFCEGRFNVTCAMPSRRSMLICSDLTCFPFNARMLRHAARKWSVARAFVTCISRLIDVGASSHVRFAPHSAVAVKYGAISRLSWSGPIARPKWAMKLATC
jgi:hypothetical protein